jgi:hypothetical protein
MLSLIEMLTTRPRLIVPKLLPLLLEIFHLNIPLKKICFPAVRPPLVAHLNEAHKL